MKPSIRQIIYASLITLAMILLIMNWQNTQALRTTLTQQQTNTQKTLGSLKTDIHTIKQQLEHTQQALNNLQTLNHNIQQNQLELQQALQKHQLQTLIEETIHHALEKLTNQLNQLNPNGHPQTQTANPKPINPITINQSPPGYRIWGFESYGAVIQTPDNRFIIARIGKNIDHLGTVTNISNNAVHIGKWVIKR